MNNDELFYPSHSGFKARQTSIDAAQQVSEKAPTLRAQVFKLLQAQPLTADQVAAVLGRSILSIRPRLSELAANNLIQDSGLRRPNASGKKAIVWEETNERP